MRHLMNGKMNRKTAISSALMAILIGSISADAIAGAPGYEVVTRTVKFADLDLTRSPGAAVLYSRIQTAARAVCEPAGNTGARDALLLSRRCTEQAISQAVADVHVPVLTSYYLVKTKQVITLARQR